MPAGSDGPLAHPLARALARGRRAYRGLALPEEVFATRVLELTRQRLARAGAEVSPARLVAELDRIAARDLFLAIACDADIPGAWEALTAEYIPRLRGLLRHVGTPETQADELATALPGELIASPGGSGARTRLGTYDGSGSLFAWLAMLVLRAQRHGRRLARAVSLEERVAAGIRGESTGHADPAETARETELGERFSAALRDSWQALTDQERIVVALKHGQGLKQSAIARVLQVGPARVSRILARAVRQLRAAGTSAVPEQDRITPAGLWRVLRDALGLHLANSALAVPPTGSETTDHGPAAR